MSGLGSSALAVMRSPSQAISGSGSLSSPPVKKPTLASSAAAAGAPAAPPPAAPPPAAPTLAAPTLAAALPTYGKSSNSALKRLAKERGLKQAGDVLKRNQKFDLWQQDSASHPAPGEEGGPTPAAGAKTMARTSGSASSSNGSGEEPAIEALMERARSSEFGANLTKKEWLHVLHEVAADNVEATIAGGTKPKTTKQHGKAANGISASEQYRLRFLAWDQGLQPPVEPPSTLPAIELPTADPDVHITHLSEEELIACKEAFIASTRNAAESAIELSRRPHLDMLLRRCALAGVDWLEENMSNEYAAELMHTNPDGTGRERVRELHGPVGFVREHVLAEDPQFYGEDLPELTQEESDTYLVAILFELMIGTYATNFETHRELLGLPYVPFRGAFLHIGDLTIMINESGHFQAFYADRLATEDIAQLHRCETGRGLMQLYRAGGQTPTLVANATTHLDLWRAAANTRKMHRRPTDQFERSYKTATPWRLAMEAGAKEEPFPRIAQLARHEHGWRLLFYRGLGVKQERVRKYGEPSSYFTESRISIEPAFQQRTLLAGLQKLLTPERLRVVLNMQENVALDNADFSQLPYIEQVFFNSVHLQDVYASGAAIFRVHKAVYLLDCDPNLTEEQLKKIDHEMKIQMNHDITAKLERARADLAAARKLVALELANVCCRLSCQPTPKLKALLTRHTLLEQAEYMANSRSRGGTRLACPHCCFACPAAARRAAHHAT